MKFIFIVCLFFSCTILVAQNVGVGTTTPTLGRFQVSGAVGLTSAIFGGEGAGISLQRNAPSIGFNEYNDGSTRNMQPGRGMVQWLNTINGSLLFDQSGETMQPDAVTGLTRRLTISQNGNVSLNAGEANATLFIGGANTGAVSASFRGSSYYSYFYESVSPNLTLRNTYINAGKNGSGVFINDKDGGYLLIGGGTTKVGINTDPTDIFEIKQYGRGLALINPSFAYWEMYVEKNLTENASDFYLLYNGGNLGNFYSGDGKYYYYSDRRVKQNIQPMAKVLPGILSLKPCEYEMKYDNPGHLKSMGFIAQEVRTIFPEITGHIVSNEIGYNSMPDLYTLNYDAMGPLAVKAIQEQQELIQKLQQQVENLRKRVQALKQPVTSTPALQTRETIL